MSSTESVDDVRPRGHTSLKLRLLRVNWVRLAALFLVLITCSLSMSAMAVGNWVKMKQSSTDGLITQIQSYEWGPLVYCLQNTTSSAAEVPLDNSSISYNTTSYSFCGQYGGGFNDDWPSKAWLAVMFLFNSGSACAAMAVITTVFSLFWNTDKASVAFSVCSFLFFFTSVFTFPAGFGGSLPQRTVSGTDDANGKPIAMEIPTTRVCGDAGTTYKLGDCTLDFAVGFNIAVIFTIAAAALLYLMAPKYAERMRLKRAHMKGKKIDAETTKYKGYM